MTDQFIKFYKAENAKSVVDFGCGRCEYIGNIKKAGFDAQGYDGNPYTPQISNGVAGVLDLTEKHDLGRKYDWVQSLEVGEHIPPEKTATFVDNLARHAEKGIVISWAIIGQNGFYHVNNKANL